ncbi:Bacterio-opsin activator HTH domain-containing protein [Halosimplex carlsbadense 2-9-1]|uniref:Bacterio-opsin activator HTH domain-containing protein n=1 Tax=Halosimplex carlsbadense 2-9-1 TaxID=797114 RepID=M0CNA7_9EURY|nr:helix-turn-helix domain-containing protein [Halosimplex carlsbadense]ELZ24098.1 Bacterio-opsin activator HTH domain-containing protein [Halosimplex carlsbadense 2-9-1]
MPRANLEITVPDSVWIGELSREYPDAQFEILTVFPKEEGGVALAEIAAEAVKEVVLAMDDYEAVTNTDFLQRTAETALVQFETSNPVLLLPVRNAGTPLELPFSVVDGSVEWEVTAPRDRLSTLGDQLRQFGIEFEVMAVRQEMETEQLLTPKQLRLVQTAVEEGYYDTPRECTLTELAEESDIAKSTCSETLHRAEEKIVKEFVDETDPVDERTPAMRA